MVREEVTMVVGGIGGKGVFVCLDEGQMQTQRLQLALFVCLDTFWARPARWFK